MLPSFVKIGLPVPDKKIVFKVLKDLYMGMAAILVM